MESAMRKNNSLRYGLFIILGLLILAGSACRSATEAAQEGDAVMAVLITSDAFKQEEIIPAQFTCDGMDKSPALTWEGIPANAKSLALIADDPDAPIGTWVHWVLYDIPPTLQSLPEDVAKSPFVPGIGTQGINDFRKTGYNGPCPPRGKPHRYFFKLYALDTILELKSGASKVELEKAMRGHILAQGELMGKFGR
jgi:Raf kinase inhibitor-like YbhB/YbcL family protein